MGQRLGEQGEEGGKRIDFPRPPRFSTLGAPKKTPPVQYQGDESTVSRANFDTGKAKLETLSRQVHELVCDIERFRMVFEEHGQLSHQVGGLRKKVEELEQQISGQSPVSAPPAVPIQHDLGETLVDLNLDTESAPPIGFTLDDLLRVVIKHGASDLHLKPNAPPTVRLNGDLVPIGGDLLTPEQSRYLVLSSLPMVKRRRLLYRQEVDHAYVCEGVRFRLNAFLERGHVTAAFRMVSSEIPTFQSLGLPPVLERLAMLNDGLVLVTGPAGSGKSTTLASMIDYINSRRKAHIVTIEDPIEFHHHDKNSFITQREVGTDTSSFTEALKQALRQDPNVIMLGEMRDAETIMTAVTAAETGHLVFSTLHTPNAVQAVDRVVDTFIGQSQKQVRVLLSTCLRAVISQKLLNRKAGAGRIPATEVMVCTSTIASHILDGQTTEIHQYIEQGRNEGMQTFTQSLTKLVEDGLISREDALHYADSPTDVRFATEGRSTGTSTHRGGGFINYL